MTTAWGDESIRSKGFERPVYLLGASVVHSDVDRACELLTALKPRHANKLHWRDMDRAHQWVSIHTINALDATHTVIVGTRASPEKLERARRECLKRMLTALEVDCIDEYRMESRGPDLDQKDLNLRNYLRKSHVLSKIQLGHVKADKEPLVWIPDQVLGAYGNAMEGETEYHRFLDEKVLDEVFALR